MVLGVGDIERVALEREPLRLVERGVVEAPVAEAAVATSDHRLHLAVEIGDEDAVVSGVADEEPAAGLVGQDLAGEHERRRGREPLGLEREGPPVDHPSRVELLDHLADEVVERLEGKLALVSADDLALGVDEHERRPGARRIGLPDAKVAVIRHRMADVEAEDGRADRLGLPLAREFRRVDADDGELPAPLALELPQLRKEMQAVDSAEGPEVEQDQLAAQVVKRERAPRIEPVGVGQKVGRVDLAGEPLRHRARSPWSPGWTART